MFNNIAFFQKNSDKNLTKTINFAKNKNIVFSSIRLFSKAIQDLPLRAQQKTTCSICGFDIAKNSEIVVIRNNVSHRHCAVMSMFERLKPSKNNHPHVFSRCHCGSLKIRGICQDCGWVTACSLCKKVQQANGEWIEVHHEQNIASHTLCPDCTEKYCMEQAVACVEHQGECCVA